MKTVLLTGGAGYVGSHCAKAFHESGWTVVTLDNLSRGNRDLVKWGPLIEADIADRAAVAAAVRQYRPDVCVHMAAYAYVGESVEKPELYYENNSAKSLALLETLTAEGVKKLIFSSTCASYGHPVKLPIDETHPQAPINPYGWSKFIIERMLEDFAVAHGFNSVALRYFNAAGCDADGETGECHEPETHVIPLALKAAIAATPFHINGTDFDTRDGTAVRDYIHVSDLARAHVLAAEALAGGRLEGANVFNLGTGNGTSVAELVAAVGRAVGKPLNAVYGPRRAGDPALLIASAERAAKVLNWTPRCSDIDHIVETALRWEMRSR